MKFVINKIILWGNSSDDAPKEIEFLPNKVNVVTGESNTGKTCILKIIDYCLFGASNEVPDDINENISFYALVITIKDKVITIGRASLLKGNRYYFSKTGDIPLVSPFFNQELLVDESTIKRFLSDEYVISESYELMKVGSRIREGSRLKLQYFSIFNTISQNLIMDEENFFDFDLNKRNPELYKNVLDSIFDLCIGLSSKEIYDIRKEIVVEEGNLNRIKNKIEQLNRKISNNAEFIKKLIFKARKLDLVDDLIDEDNLEEAFQIINDRINSEFSELRKISMPNDFNTLDEQRFVLRQKVRKIVALQKEVSEYAKIIDDKEDSLKPIEYLYANRDNLLLLPELKNFVDSLETELKSIKKSISVQPKATLNLGVELEDYKKQLSEVDTKLKYFPNKKGFAAIDERNIALIETRVEIKNFLERKEIVNSTEVPSLMTEREYYDKKIRELQNQLPDDEQGDRIRRLNLLNDTIQTYYDQVSKSMDQYKDYKIFFNEFHKTVGLIKPNDDQVSTISGSSNYLFLQLCLFLGLHEMFIKKKIQVNYVPQYLIIDYPSLPYKNNGDIDVQTDDDLSKMRNVFELLNNFINIINREYGEEFQIIILEHINSDVWEKPSVLENFHLVRDFRNGEKLLS